MQIINIKMTSVIKKAKKTRGFTMGLALIIVATTLLISISMSTLLMRDLKNSSSNTKSSIAYNVAESALECVSSHEDSIRYFDNTGDNKYGVFPISTTYGYSKASHAVLGVSAATAGYAFKNYDINNENGNNKYFNLEQIKCFGVEFLNNIRTGAAIQPDSITTLKPTENTAPTGYYSATGNTGVVTEIKLDKDKLKIKDQNGNNMDVCVNVKVYSVSNLDSTNSVIGYKRLIQSEAVMPCAGGYKTKRLLVKYFE